MQAANIFSADKALLPSSIDVHAFRDTLAEPTACLCAQNSLIVIKVTPVYDDEFLRIYVCVSERFSVFVLKYIELVNYMRNYILLYMYCISALCMFEFDGSTFVISVYSF